MSNIDNSLSLDNYPDMMTIDEAAKYLRIGKTQMYGLLQNNIINGVKLGNKWIIPKEAFIKYRESIINKSNKRGK